ncbi:contractile injection system protein, VgrG/Pvc8 family, partial [Paraburkholderia sacchari]
ALLKRIVKSDTFKDVTLQELITQAVIDRKNFDAFDVEFQIEGLDQKMEQVVMYEESLYNLIARHCRRKGVFWFYKQGRAKDGRLDTIVFSNNPRAYVRSIDVPLLDGAGLNSNWQEAAQKVNEQRRLVPAAIEVWERNYRTP